MKAYIYLCSICAIIVGVSLIKPAEAQEGRFYDIVCRKGDNSIFFDTKQDNSIEITLRFTRSAVPAARRNSSGGFVGYNNLQPGECSWKYRTIRRDEPSNVKWQFENYTLFVATSTTPGTSILLRSIPERPEIISPAQRLLSKVASYSLLNQTPAESEQNYFTIRVRNNGRHFEVRNDRYRSIFESTRSGRDI